MCSGDEYDDIPIPTWYDWARVQSYEGKFYSDCQIEPYTFDYDWDDKIPTAMFRGRTTGFGLTFETNMRLKISKLSLQNKVDKNGILFLDAGITKWNVRPRKIKHSKNIGTFDKDVLSLPLVDFKTPKEQSKYKYIVNIDGHVSAYRLSMELGYGSVVLLVKSKYKLWFSDMLKEYIHYIPIENDLSDLYEKILWCKTHDEECKIIAKNAKQFHDTFLSKEGIFDYLCNVLNSFQCKYEYNSLKVEQMQRQYENNLIDKSTCQSDGDFILYKENIKHEIKVDIKNGKIVKIPKYDSLKNELIHESVVGMYCINNISSNNFSKTYGYCKTSKGLYSEYLNDCQTFHDYLQSDHFNMNDYINILIEISDALNIAQKKYFFMHNDLYPWNILLNNQHPIIIDYGKSCCLINGLYLGIYSGIYSGIHSIFHPSHDILCILVSSMYQIFKSQKLSNSDMKIMFKLANYFSNTKFSQNKTFKKVGELKSFLCECKKFSTMIDVDKSDFDCKTPEYFKSYLTNGNLKIQPYNFSFTLDSFDDPREMDYWINNIDDGNVFKNTFLWIIENL